MRELEDTHIAMLPDTLEIEDSVGMMKDGSRGDAEEDRSHGECQLRAWR